MSLALDPVTILQDADPELHGAIRAEERRQLSTLEMIASENFSSEAVRAASGSVFAHKYAEGYPGKRYYHGCGPSDVAETLAIDRLKALFGAEYANVQPHSGSTANQAVFNAFMNPGDTILSLSLAHGGHLSHGHGVTMVGKVFKIANYSVRRDTELIDYDEAARLALEHKPRVVICGGSAYPRLIDFARFREIADSVGAILLTDMAHFAGLVAGKAIPSPVPHSDVVTSTTHKTLRGPRGGLILAKAEHEKALNKAVFPGLQGGPLVMTIAAKAVAFREALQPSFARYAAQTIKNAQVVAEVMAERGLRCVSGGTDTHLVLVDLSSYGVSGKVASEALEHAGVTINMNMIPYDTRKPTETSGIRIGAPALTSRGMKESEFRTIANWIADVVKAPDDEALIRRVRGQVEELASGYPLRAEVE
ncbi:MAG: serine hydroxymethyltransferase [Candidatus Sumerlaeia bacterium]|nr:serine hydroxymethyltransferase [Candidatus Sumerlaeia bacterium]